MGSQQYLQYASDHFLDKDDLPQKREKPAADILTPQPRTMAGTLRRAITPYTGTPLKDRQDLAFSVLQHNAVYEQRNGGKFHLTVAPPPASSTTPRPPSALSPALNRWSSSSANNHWVPPHPPAPAPAAPAPAPVTSRWTTPPAPAPVACRWTTPPGLGTNRWATPTATTRQYHPPPPTTTTRNGKTLPPPMLSRPRQRVSLPVSHPPTGFQIRQQHSRPQLAF